MVMQSELLFLLGMIVPVDDLPWSVTLQHSTVIMLKHFVCCQHNKALRTSDGENLLLLSIIISVGGIPGV